MDSTASTADTAPCSASTPPIPPTSSTSTRKNSTERGRWKDSHHPLRPQRGSELENTESTEGRREEQAYAPRTMRKAHLCVPPTAGSANKFATPPAGGTLVGVADRAGCMLQIDEGQAALAWGPARCTEYTVVLRRQVASQTCLQSRLHAQHGAAQPTGQEPARGFPHPSSVPSVSSNDAQRSGWFNPIPSPLPIPVARAATK